MSSDERRVEDEHVWENIRRLDKDLAGVMIDVGSILTTQESQGLQLNRIENILSRPNNTNWGWLISGVSLVILIGGLTVTVLKSDTARLETRVFRNELATEKDFEQFDEVLQREMRLRDGTMNREMTLSNDALSAKIDTVDRVSSMRYDEQQERIEAVGEYCRGPRRD